jgi:hypothetical protein
LAVVEIGISRRDFWDMTIDEFGEYMDAYRRREDARALSAQWATAALAAMYKQVNYDGHRPADARDYLRLPFADVKANAQLPSPEEVAQKAHHLLGGFVR